MKALPTYAAIGTAPGCQSVRTACRAPGATSRSRSPTYRATSMILYTLSATSRLLRAPCRPLLLLDLSPDATFVER